MMKKLVLVSFLTMLGCSNEKENVDQTPSFRQFETEQLTLSIPQTIRSETLFNLSVRFNRPISQLKSYLVSITMDMGTMPIIFTQQPNQHQQSYSAKVIVGSCSEPTMEWQLNISWVENGERYYHSQPLTILR